MAKAVMLSIRPEWVEKILSGEKTVEVRKTAPKIAMPFKCYIYCTQPKPGKSHQYDAFGLNGKPVECGGTVLAEFVCDRISTIAYTMDGLADVVDCKTSCLNPKDFIEYGKGKPLYGWHISNLKVYGKPKELCEFTKYSEDDIRPCQNGDECRYMYYDYGEDCTACGIDFDGENCPFIKMQRPPQSWCYVEG